MSIALDLADLAAAQWGLVTTAQARGVGASAQRVARLTSQGALVRLTHGVYRITGAPPDPLDELRAAWLALDPGRRASERLRDLPPEVVSHRSAAAVHGLGDLEADELEFTVSGRKQTRRPDVRIHRGVMEPGEWTVVDGLPVTTVAGTVSDLVAARIDGGHLAAVVRDAVMVMQTDTEPLMEALRPYAHRYGAPLGDGEAFLAQLLQEAGVSEPVERAVSLVGTNRYAAAAVASSPAVQQLQKQMATIQKRLAPQLADVPRLPRAAHAAGDADAKHSRTPEMVRLADQIHALLADPQNRLLLEEQARTKK